MAATTGYSLQELLGYVSLTGTIEQVRDGIPNPLPPKLFQQTGKTIGDTGRYTVTFGQRQTARLSQYGAPAVRRAMKNMSIKDVKLLHSIEEQAVDPIALQQLRQFDNYDVQRMGMQVVKKQLKYFTQAFMNLRIATTGLVLANGTLWFDASGNLLPSSSGSVETVSFQMAANNQNQLNGIIATRWDNVTADIPAQLRALKLQAMETTGYPLKLAFYGKNIPSQLSQNDFVHDFLSRENKTMDKEYLDTGEIPQGLFGFEWIPVYDMFWEDSTNTNQVIFGNNAITFTPEITEEWWGFLEGSYLVPTTINIVSDAVAALDSLKQIYGMAGYGQVTLSPVGVKTTYLDTFIPVLTNPDAVFQGVTVF